MLGIKQIFNFMFIRPFVFSIDPFTASLLFAGGIGGGLIGASGAQSAAETSAAGNIYAADLLNQQYLQNRQDLMPWMDVATGGGPQFQPGSKDPAEQQAFQDALAAGSVDAQGYALDAEGNRSGALNQLAGYGRSQVNQGDYIPASALPDFDPRSNIQDFSIGGNQPVYDPSVDMSRDPGVAFRQQEQERSINRNMAGMGKILSGNRMEELMARSGDLASQEYGAAYDRGLQDYEIDRAREAITYGRDVTGFDYGRAAESDRYGRDLTAYDAGMAQENLLYGRGVGDYGRAYGQEGDYLNRLASLSNVGQTTAMGLGQQGIQAAQNIGSNISGAAATQGAGAIGQASAWQGALGDLTSLGTSYMANQGVPTYSIGADGSFGYDYPGGINSNLWNNNPNYR